MRCQKDKTQVYTGFPSCGKLQNGALALTLVEMVIAMAIMAIILAVLLPQFRVIQNSWDSKQGSAETLQNGRVLIDHLNRNLSKAVRITAVSGSAETNGYIEFEDNDSNNLRYDIAANNYVEFGPVGDLSELAGPVSQLQFTCYNASDLDTPITDVNSIRFVKVETTLTNSVAMGQDKTFIGWAYLRANNYNPLELNKETPFEFAAVTGKTPALSKIDDTHYLCAYAGDGDDGWAVVLTITAPLFDAISMETPFEFDASNGEMPALSKIDNTHYLCAYAGYGDDGWATVLTVDTGTWAITNETPFEFDTKKGFNPALSQMSSTNYLCTYQAFQDLGWAVILKVDTGSWTISKEDAYKYEENYATISALAQLDQTHYLCAHMGPWSDGWAIVLASTPSLDTISKQGEGLEFDPETGLAPTLVEIDDSHYLCAYQGPGDDGWAVVLQTFSLRP